MNPILILALLAATQGNRRTRTVQMWRGQHYRMKVQFAQTMPDGLWEAILRAIASPAAVQLADAHLRSVDRANQTIELDGVALADRKVDLGVSFPGFYGMTYLEIAEIDPPIV